MAELRVGSLSGHTFTSGTTTYLVPQESIGLVVGASGASSTLDVEWLLVAEDANGTFGLTEFVTETGVPLATLTANPTLLYLWS